MNLQRVSLAIIWIPFLGNSGDGKRQREGGGQTGEQFSRVQGEVIVSLFNLGGLACSMREARAKAILTAQPEAYNTQCDRFVNELSSLEKTFGLCRRVGSGLRLEEVENACSCSVRGSVLAKLR